MAKSILFVRASNQNASITDALQTGLDFTTDHTFEVWVKLTQLPSSAGNAFAVITKDVGGSPNRSYRWILHHTANVPRSLYFDTAGNSTNTETTTPLIATVWQHWAITVDISSQTVIYYLNGIAQVTVPIVSGATTLGNSNADVQIGDSYTGNEHFDGLMFDFRVWSVLRTPAQILANYQQLLPPQAGLGANWQFNDDYLDSSGNNNTLTPTNSPTFSTDVPYIPGGVVSTASGNFLHINRLCSIFHFVKTGDKEEYDTTPYISQVKFQIIPAGSDILATFPGVPSYSLHEMFCFDMVEVLNGDKVIDENGDEYIIRGEPQRVNTSQLTFQQFVGEKVSGI